MNFPNIARLIAKYPHLLSSIFLTFSDSHLRIGPAKPVEPSSQFISGMADVILDADDFILSVDNVTLSLDDVILCVIEIVQTVNDFIWRVDDVIRSADYLILRVNEVISATYDFISVENKITHARKCPKRGEQTFEKAPGMLCLWPITHQSISMR